MEKKCTRLPFDQRVYLASPTMHGDELKYITEAFATNWVSTVGENIDCVESALSQILRKRYSVALSSGTGALHMAIKCCAEKLYGKSESGAGTLAGKKVFCSDLTFAATINPVLYEGGEPVLIDSEYDTWNMDPIALERAFERYPDVRLVVLVHLYGTPAKMDQICSICKRHGALLVEDAAEALGASYRGEPLGSFGNIGVISFNGNKIITGSCGGLIVTDDRDDMLRIRKWSTQSREPVAWYQHTDIGYNYRMSNLIAGVIRGQLPHLQEHIEPFDIQVVRVVGDHIHGRCQIHVIVLHGRLEIIELTLSREMTVIAVHATEGQSHFLGLYDIGEATLVGDSRTSGSHNVDELQIVLFADCRPIHSTLIL